MESPRGNGQTFKNGWLLTGDLGYMDEQGYFYIVDRKKDVIIAGGFNIYPREIEEVLYEHEAVRKLLLLEFLIHTVVKQSKLILF